MTHGILRLIGVDTITFVRRSSALAGTCRSALRLALLGSLPLALPSLVNAQTAPDASPQPSAGVLQEIVVTAARREETVLQTPISLTAISGLDIENRGYTDFNSLLQTVPGVAVANGGPGQMQIAIRGVSAVGGNSPTVGFYFGDTSLTAPSGSNNGYVVISPSDYDLSRVEVLRGPQGTLYGASSMGGTVRLIPNAPDPRGFDASGKLTLSDTDGGGFNPGASAMLNLPLVQDKVALRLVATERYTSGWIDRIVVAPGEFPLETNGGMTRGDVQAAPVALNDTDANSERFTAGRIELLLKPIDGLTVTPMAVYQETLQNMPNDFDSVPGTLAHYEPYDIREPFSDRFTLENLNINYRAPWFSVTSVTSYWKRNQRQVQDDTEVLQLLFDAPSYGPPDGLGPTPFTATDATHQFSQEVRLVSPSDTRFTWLVGGYYSSFESISYNQSYEASLAPVYGTGDLFWKAIPTNISQRAGFGEISYEILPGLRVTAGVRRYYYDTKVVSHESGIVGPTGNDTIQTSANLAASNSGDNPKFELSYHPNDDLTAYGTASKGFRPGGGNHPIPAGTNTTGSICDADLHTLGLSSEPLAFGPDSLWSYELGEKSHLFRGRLDVNADVYREDWTGIQQGVSLSCGYGFTANAGAARIYGTEFEAEAIVIKGLTASVSVGYSHARVVEGSAAAGTVAGDPIQYTPDLTTNVGLTDEYPISNGLDLISHIENTYVSRRYDVGYISLTPMPPYALTNVRIGIRGDHLTTSLFVNNVFNRRAWLGIGANEAASIPTFAPISSNQPLTFGIDATYHFR